jgi:hypothetical protein
LSAKPAPGRAIIVSIGAGGAIDALGGGASPQKFCFREIILWTFHLLRRMLARTKQRRGGRQIGGEKDRRFGKNAFSKFFDRNPLISLDAAKEMFGKSLEKIWSPNCRSD